MGIATYASLLQKKMVIPSLKGNYIAIEKHFLINCLTSYLERVKFDETWYLHTYPDVKEAIAARIVADPKEHYTHFGFYEHRQPYRIPVDEPWYLAQYQDVQVAIDKQHVPSGQAHFERDGFREGRFPYPNFKLELDERRRT
jgi:hypothetical protein